MVDWEDSDFNNRCREVRKEIVWDISKKVSLNFYLGFILKDSGLIGLGCVLGIVFL